jgi:hypothetical protein
MCYMVHIKLSGFLLAKLTLQSKILPAKFHLLHFVFFKAKYKMSVCLATLQEMGSLKIY